MKINGLSVFVWVLRLVAATIMLQTLYFKFTAAPESVYIFSTLGLEPFGRIGIGVLELIASVLILYPPTTIFGSVLAVGLMSGALLSHVTKLGIVVQNDGGLLFIYATLVWVSSIGLVLVFRNHLYNVLKLNPKYRF